MNRNDIARSTKNCPTLFLSVQAGLRLDPLGWDEPATGQLSAASTKKRSFESWFSALEEELPDGRQISRCLCH
jgi:hypothetical protein